MALEDVAGEAEAKHHEMDQDDVQDLRDKVDALEERFKRLHRVVVNIDGRMDSMDDDMKVIKKRMMSLEETFSTEDSEDDDGFLSDWEPGLTDDSSEEDEDDEDEDLPWQ